MPKRSERSDFAHAFDGNPFEGLNPNQVYKELRWGDVPVEKWKIDSPEPLVSLGELAALFLSRAKNPREEWPEDEGPFVAVGTRTNRVYLLPRIEDGGPARKVTRFNPKTWQEQGKVRRTDYFSVKGGEPAYYYHDHQSPLPSLWEHPSTGVRLLVPAVHKGKPSYGVVTEGIVG